MIEQEISIMMKVNHPTIIKFIGYSELDFNDKNNLTIIMELEKNGSLRDIIKNIQKSDGPKDYTNTSRQIIPIGVARAMKCLHDHKIVHRTIKADNFLLDDDFHPLLTDFSLSKIIEEGQSYCQSVDVYAFGILTFEILTDFFFIHNSKKII